MRLTAKLTDRVTARWARRVSSCCQPAPEGGLPEPLFPEPLPEGNAYHALVDRVKANEIIRGKPRSRTEKNQLSAAAPPGVVLRVALGIVRIVAGINFAEVRLSGGIDRLIGVSHMP
jgi:hypothetical protein